MKNDTTGWQVELEKGMVDCYQSAGQNMLEHGLSVWKYTQKLINSDTSDMILPQWYDNFKTELINNLHNLENIRLYNIYHDNGKYLCKIVDSNGKAHYPNHADVSKLNWLNHGGSDLVANLIGLDMIFHTETKEQIQARNLDKKDLATLLLTALAELHANAEMFGGTESTSFKIKFKKLEKVGKWICDTYFSHAYVYVIVRKDLPNAQKAVQSAHACIEATRDYLKKTDEHPSVIICEVKSENKLKMVMEELRGKINFKAFREPDIGNQFTAIASEPIYGEKRDLFKRFQLIS